MVPPASRTPPAALHQPALGDCFTFSPECFLYFLRTQLVQSKKGEGLSPEDLPTHHYSPLPEKTVWCGEKLERGQEEEKKEVLTVFQLHLDPSLGFWDSEMNQKNLTALEGHKV